ncbi:MAG: hypothetical protein ACLTFW_09940 [Klebsiella pneumoniae]
MTPDITQLAQSEINDALAQLKQISEYPTPSTQYALVLRKYITSQAEALEKAQQVDEELCRLLPPGAEYMDPPDGGDVTPLEGVRRMVADYRQRIADLESRTVTFKLPFTPEPSAFAPWVAKAFYQFHKDTVKSCVAVFSDACRAAGIKVEAE